MRRASCIAFVVAAACSSTYGENEPAPPVDAGNDADVGVPNDAGAGDASADTDADAEAGTTCATTDPFTSVEPLGLGSAGIATSDARFSLDEKVVVFKRRLTDAGTPDGSTPVTEVFTASRNSTNDPFPQATAFTELTTTADIIAPTLSPNLLTMVYSRYLSAGSAWDISSVTRATPTSPFSAASVDGVNAGSNTTDFYPYLSHDGTRLYFASSRNNQNSLFAVPFGSGDAPQNLDRKGAEGTDFAPVVTGDGRTMYFARTAAGNLSVITASSVIYVAHRPTNADPFEEPTAIADVDVNVVSSRNLPSWISPDRCRLYLTSSRGGRLDVYVARRTPK